MDWLRVCGARSLPIYLGFYIPMSLAMTAYLLAERWVGLTIDPGTLAALLAVLSIFVALLAQDLLQRTPLAWLYLRPRWAQVSAGLGGKASMPEWWR
jgi:uncharacterized membrane protein YcfT